MKENTKVNCTFKYYTNMCKCWGEQVGGKVEVMLSNRDAIKFLNLFGDNNELDGDVVEAGVGKRLWKILRDVMDKDTLFIMSQDALYEVYNDIAEEYDKEFGHLLGEDMEEGEVLPFEQLSIEEKVAYLNSKEDDMEVDWEIAAIARPEIQK